MISIAIRRTIKNAVKIPVIGNGDIFTSADAIRMLEQTKCDGIMIGRGAMGNPWLFDEIICALENNEYTPSSIEERIGTAIGQLDDMIIEYGERTGVAQAKKHMAWYIAGMRGSAAARGRIMSADSADTIKAILSQMAE